MILKLPWPPSSTHLPRLPHLRRLFHSSTDTSFTDASSIFHYAIKSCSETTSLATSHSLHARLIRTGLVSSRFLQNHLLNAYFKCDGLEDARRLVTEIEYPNVFTYNAMIIGYGICNRLGDAEQVFDKMPERDPVSWSSMLSACFRNGKPERAVRLFVWMVGEENGRVPDQHSVTCVMKAVGRIGFLGLAIQVHGFVEKFGFGDVSEVCASLIDMYIKCGAVGLAEQVFRRVERPSLFCLNSMLYGYSISSGIRGSLDFFYRMEERDVVSWHTIISLLSQHGYAVQALEMFVQMSFQGFRTNSETYASVLSACTDLNDWDWGRHLHARIVRSESSLDMYTGSGFIDMYAKWGFIKSARWIFNSLKNPNVVSWTSLIAGVAQFGNADEALMLFNCMRGANFKPDDYVVATVFGACSSDEEFYYLGKQLHGLSVKSGTESSIPVGNALITMYSKGGNVQDANSAFDSMPQRDIISWTSMITAYSQSGDVRRAREYFDKMPHRNIVSWTSMLGAYVQQGFWEEGLNFYVTMLRQGIKPDCVTFATSLSACADSVLLQLGKQIIGQAEKSGHSSDIAIANCYITLYSRSGLIHDAEIVFDSLHTKNLVSWNSMLSGYAQNGYPRRVIDLYEGMISAGCTPDGVSYLSVLMGCSHAGLVLQGRHYFDSMMKNHCISPSPEHYTCMVDLLGRAGLIEQAKDLVDMMPFEPNAAVWSALLSACRNCLNTELAEFAMRKLHELDADDSGVYVLLSNAYMDSGKLEDVMNTRKMMRERGIAKIIGCSWIEVHSKTHVFSAEDTNHPQIEEILDMLERVISKMDDDRCCLDMKNLVEPV